jgi:DnaJ-class molecular chaperone
MLPRSLPAGFLREGVVLDHPLGLCDLVECVGCAGTGRDDLSRAGTCGACDGYGRVVFSPAKMTSAITIAEAQRLRCDGVASAAAN